MIQQLREIITDPDFRAGLRNLLFQMCQVDSTPKSDIGVMAEAEDTLFRKVEHYLKHTTFRDVKLERRPISPAIAEHPSYSPLHFTKTTQRPSGASPEEVYKDRANLLCHVPGADFSADGRNTAVNAHIDVVAPYIQPELGDGVIYGRGTCDDKGNVVAIIGALDVLGRLVGGERGLNKGITAMFVVEEETGGNGSLSLAADHSLKDVYDSIMVLECADNRVYPANRGAVWYQAALQAQQDIPMLELATFVVLELELEGRAIKAESRHPLFRQRPVQTCHGILGSYGEHPSRICGEVSFRIDFAGKPQWDDVETVITDCMASGLDMYTRIYDDKTQVTDSTTGSFKVQKHFDLRRENNAYVVDVHGSTGHMGSINENDDAITKMAFITRALMYSKNKLRHAAGVDISFSLADQHESAVLMLEGGQGFIPNHDIEEIMERIRNAVRRGAQEYLNFAGIQGKAEDLVQVSFDKLHNDAFDGDPDSPSMKNALTAAEVAGIYDNSPITGWTVSCDARLFAKEYPGMPVLTAGAGKLSHAHANDEQLNLDDLWQAVEFLASYLLLETGTCSPDELCR